VPHDGILGKPFIVGQGAIVNYQTSELILTDHSSITLLPRTGTIVAVSAPDTAEDIQILVENQKLAETITCGNCITTVKNKSVYRSLINPTMNPIQIRIPNLEQLVHEEYNEAYVQTTQVQEQSETPIEHNRIPLLHEALQKGYLNEEEQSTLLSICNDSSDIFFLDGDKLWQLRR